MLGIRSVEHAKRFRKLLPEARQIGLVPTADDIEPFAKAGVKVIRLWPKWLTDATLVAAGPEAGARTAPGHGQRNAGRGAAATGTGPESLASDDPASW